MGNLIRTKPNQKQPATAQNFEKAVLTLEHICLEIREGQFTHGKGDTDRLYWQQILKNIATPLSLAIDEYQGPRVFHQHYKHDEHDHDVMIPVMESARDNVIAACKRGLAECADITGMKGSLLVAESKLLMQALKAVLAIKI